jgi:hypothetical protein
MISLLIQGANHPSVHICAICLQVLTRMMPVVLPLSHELLPVLQRRAITPHKLKGGLIDFDASDLCGVAFHEFQSFRATVLSDALVVCWKWNGNHYMDSCTSAVEEFCSVSSSIDVSLHLEAALFCIEQILIESMEVSTSDFPHNDQLRRLVSVLPAKPPSLMSNPLARERMCSFFRKVSLVKTSLHFYVLYGII